MSSKQIRGIVVIVVHPRQVLPLSFRRWVSAHPWLRRGPVAVIERLEPFKPKIIESAMPDDVEREVTRTLEHEQMAPL